ncbi:MAG: hypothetical protein ILO68_04305 [Clostridia bacterium]|nr:hypothetical protein [Clostridia bacterium]
MLKKLIAVLLCVLLAGTLCLAAACTETPGESSGGSAEDSTASQEESVEMSKQPDERAKTYWDSDYASDAIQSPEDVLDMRTYLNGRLTEQPEEPSNANDVRYLFVGNEGARAVVFPEGYMISLPGSDVEADYSLGKYRSQYRGSDYCLTVTYEDQNPYGDNQNGYDLYMREWLVRHIENNDFLSANRIIRTRKISERQSGEFLVKDYCMQINLKGDIAYPFYQIAILRPASSYDHFYLLVMKSSVKDNDRFDAIVDSFSEFRHTGKPVCGFEKYELKENPNWNEETKAYYRKLQNQTDVDFGFFAEGHSGPYADWLWEEERLGAADVYMTYQHIGWGNQLSDMVETFQRAETYAGGNGFNGKKIFNLTYQFTQSNNGVGGYNPSFDIIRGKLDSYFRTLAQKIKNYGHPVLFRLNNEMNTDWTDYSGITSLIDPDIFQETWRRLYRIFEEEGVDNCIWIFNPIAVTCPYCNWGEDLCYFPGADYVQMLGVTYYQMNNGTNGKAPDSFKTMYSFVANKMLPYFDDYPWIIGEFGCAAGGAAYYDYGTSSYISTELGRNGKFQYDWVKGMLEIFRDTTQAGASFAKRIKVAIWFSANDYATVNGKNTITNYLKLDEDRSEVIQLIHDYLAGRTGS